MDEFPKEITTTILSNLPVKSILCCRSVCKTWLKIIDNLDFPQLHLYTSTTTKAGSSSTCTSSSYIFLPRFSNEICIAVENEKVPYTLTTMKFDLLFNSDCKLYAEPPVNGLLLYSNLIYYPKMHKDDTSMYVCNPAIREYVKLPNFEFPNRKSVLMLGFGFDIINMVFKVVVLFLWVNGQVLESETQVYTLGSSLWRTGSKAPKMRFVKGCSAYVNGSLHWLTRGEPGDGLRSKIIVSFNLSSEDFGVISSPEFNYLSTIESFKADSLIQLVKLRGCLSIVDSSFDLHIEIWVMKDYNVKESWTRFVVSKYYLEGMQFKWVNPISFRQNSEIVLLCDFLTLVSYNTETRNFTTLEVGRLINNADDFTKYFGGAFSYVESLISPKLHCRI